MRGALIAVWLCLAAAAPAAAQPTSKFHYDEFKPTTLAAIAKDVEANNTHPPGFSYILFEDIPKVRTTVTYVGEHRPVTEQEAELIQRLGQSRQMDLSAYSGLFREAYAFDDAGRRYWLPVQHPVADFFAKELKPGQRVLLYAVAAGGLAEKGQVAAPVVLVEEFDANSAQP